MKISNPKISDADGAKNSVPNYTDIEKEIKALSQSIAALGTQLGNLANTVNGFNTEFVTSSLTALIASIPQLSSTTVFADVFNGKKFAFDTNGTTANMVEVLPGTILFAKNTDTNFLLIKIDSDNFISFSDNEHIDWYEDDNNVLRIENGSQSFKYWYVGQGAQTVESYGNTRHKIIKGVTLEGVINLNLDNIKSFENLNVTDTLDVEHLKATDGQVSGDFQVSGDLYVNGTTHTVEQEQIISQADLIVMRANNSTPMGNHEAAGFIVHDYNGVSNLIVGVARDGTLRIGTGSGTAHDYTNIAYKNTDGKWYSFEIVEDEKVYTLMNPQPVGTLTDWESKSENKPYEEYLAATFTELDLSKLEPLLCRAEENDMTDRALLIWDAVTKKAFTINAPTMSNQVLKAKIGNETETLWKFDDDNGGITFYKLNSEEVEIESGSDTWVADAYYPVYVIHSGLYGFDGSHYYKVDSPDVPGVMVTSAELAAELEVSTHYLVDKVTADVEDISYEWGNSGSGSVLHYANEAAYTAALSIPEGQDGYVANNALVVIDGDKDYMTGEEK